MAEDEGLEFGTRSAKFGMRVEFGTLIPRSVGYADTVQCCPLPASAPCERRLPNPCDSKETGSSPTISCGRRPRELQASVSCHKVCRRHVGHSLDSVWFRCRVLGSRLGSSFLVHSRFPGGSTVPGSLVPSSRFVAGSIGATAIRRTRHLEPEPVNKEPGTHPEPGSQPWNQEPGTVLNTMSSWSNVAPRSNPRESASAPHWS